MNDQKIIETMIEKVEQVVRQKSVEELNEARTIDKKTVTKAIIKELEAVMGNED